MTLGTWNARYLYKEDSSVSVSKKLSKYRLDLVIVQLRALSLLELGCRT
jgi:hypothetical protein